MTGSHRQVRYWGTHREHGPRELKIPITLVFIGIWLLIVGLIVAMVWALIMNLSPQESTDDSPAPTPSPSYGITLLRIEKVDVMELEQIRLTP